MHSSHDRAITRTLVLLRRAAFTLLAVTCLAMPAVADPAALRAALGHVAKRDWDAAHAAARPAGAVAEDIITWYRLRAGDGRLGDYEGFLARRADWPGLALLRQRGEEAVARSTTPARIIAFFDGASPQTPAGALALAAALRAVGQGAKADAIVVAAWRNLRFSADQQEAFLSAEGARLGARSGVHHQARLDRLLWDGQIEEARRMSGLVTEGWRRLADARIGLQTDAAGVDALVGAVPGDLANDPGLAFARVEWRARKGRGLDAEALLVERSESAGALGDPQAWASRRAILARAAMREDRAQRAYEIAARHHLTEGAAFADLEFLAGFIALRKLGEPDRALGHFQALAGAVSGPISLSRAHYWEGRAHEAAGRAEPARTAYRLAGQHQTAFYGQLAAERLGLPLDPALIADPGPADWRSAGFMRSSVTEAALLFLSAGEVGRARQFIAHLAEGLDAAGIARLADMALALDQPNIAVVVAKQAAGRGIILPRAYFPDAAMLPGELAVSRPLALAIARRESEFDPLAVSPAGARGLMQVMPGTAKLMADALSIGYAEQRLITDPAYNARLGAAYLARLTGEFGPALTLVAAGYNAGPGRPRAWIGNLGDPRRDTVDVVDWIEHVPFTETRNYVMRVAEAYVIYRARLHGADAQVVLTPLLTGRSRE